MATISFGPNVDPSQLTPHSRDVIEHVCDGSGNPSPRVTCLNRDSAKQAAVMHANLMAHGEAASRAVYLGPGQQVIDVWKASAHLNAADTITAMKAKIDELGPHNVSHHCCDPAVLQVVDIALSSLANHAALVDIAQHHSGVDVSKCIDEPSLGCLHLEIPQPAGGQ